MGVCCVCMTLLFSNLYVYDICIIMIGSPIYFMFNNTFFFRLVPVGSPLFPPGQVLSTYMLEKFVKDKKQLLIVGSTIQEILKTFIGRSLRLTYLVYFCVNTNKFNKDFIIIIFYCYI